jgi:ribosome-associated translation inhibitor RaiA
LQELETSVLRAELLQEQVTQLKAALAREHESHADALMEVARACDTRARELEAQCEEKLARAEASHAGLMTAKDAAIADMERQQSKLESAHNATVVAKAAHVALLKKQIAKLEASHAAAVAKLEASHAATIAAKDSSQAAVARGLQGAGDQVERPPPADLLLCRAGVNTLKFNNQHCPRVCASSLSRASLRWLR